MTYIGQHIALAAWAKKKDISERRARVLCEEGRVKGATKLCGSWIVPHNASYKKLKPGRKA